MIEVALPILIPFILMLASILVRSTKISQWIGIFGSFLILFINGYLFSLLTQENMLTLYLGGWEAPYGIAFVIDFFSGLMLIVTGLIFLALSIYAVHYFKNPKSHRFYFFFFALYMGVNGAFITGDVFNLYVWFEIMLISSFVLITLGQGKEQLEGAIKYLALNLIGSLLFLAGLGLLYGKTGTLNMAHLAQILREDNQAILMNSSAMLFFVAFGIKTGVFPLYYWLPASYHTPNITITSLFAGILTKVGVYVLIRFFTLFFVQDQEFWHHLLLVIAGLTMVLGGMAASTFYETRRILSYHIISQVGYMIMGLGIFTPLAIAGAIFFTIHNMLAKTNTFLVSGVIAKLKGTFDLKSVGGLYNQSPLLAILFIIPAFALAGLPPLSGFFAKFVLIKAGIEDGHYVVTALAVLTSLLTLYSMIKIWNEAFLKKDPNDKPQAFSKIKFSVSDIIPSAILGISTILMGLLAFKVFQYTMMAANQLVDASIYIKTVLNLPE